MLQGCRLWHRSITDLEGNGRPADTPMAAPSLVLDGSEPTDALLLSSASFQSYTNSTLV